MASGCNLMAISNARTLHPLWAQGLHYGFLWRCLFIPVELWIWVNSSSTCSCCMRSQRLKFAGSDVYLSGHFIHINFCFVILCQIRSPQLTGKPFDCCSCTTYILQDDSLHVSRQALNGHLLMTSLSYFGSLHASEGSPSNLLIGFSSVVVILWCLRFPTLICSPCVRDSLYLISLMSLHLFSDCMSFDLELYKLQIVGGVKLFIISMIFDRFVQSLSP